MSWPLDQTVVTDLTKKAPLESPGSPESSHVVDLEIWGKSGGKIWENLRKICEKTWENLGKCGKMWENVGKTWENLGKIMGR